MTVAGVISDTHGLLRPEALPALTGVDLILHAGDVGRPEILAQLKRIAPVHAIAGNVDPPGWLPATLSLSIEKSRLYLIHNIADGGEPNGHDVVIYGHSHKPSIERRGGILYVNPGSAGPRRFALPVTLALLRISGGDVNGEIVTLISSPPSPR